MESIFATLDCLHDDKNRPPIVIWVWISLRTCPVSRTWLIICFLHRFVSEWCRVFVTMINKWNKQTIELCIFIIRKSYSSSTLCHTQKTITTEDAFEESRGKDCDTHLQRCLNRERWKMEFDNSGIFN